MLYLLKQEGGSNFYYLISGKEYVVGRKNAHITISDDQSISRKHAVLKVESDLVKLIDCGSKYGTSHKGNKVTPNTEVNLEDQDVVRFGVFQSSYKLEKVAIVTTGSGLDKSQKSALKKDLELLGGTFLTNWESTCTYLTVQEIMLTIKVLQALIDGKPFVTLEYWKKLVESMQQNQPPPKIEDFKPRVAEMLLNRPDLTHDPQRKVLFKGKTFVFPTEKIKSKVEDLVRMTGGESISWDKKPVPFVDITGSKNSYIFIHSDEVSEVPDSLKSIYEHLRKLGQRTVPIQEIALAVLKCSSEKDCNPYLNRAEKVFLKQETDSCSEVYPLAYETQSQDLTAVPKEEIIIPASLISTDWEMCQPSCSKDSTAPIATPVSKASSSNVNPNTSTSSKRVSNEQLENPFKKMKFDKTTKIMKQQQIRIIENENESKKRKAEEDLLTPSKKSSLKENPFAIIRNKNANRKISSDNPFAGLRVKQENNSDENPFRRASREQSNEVSIIEERVQETSKSQPSLPLSDISVNYVRKNKIIDLSNIKWLSKNSCKSESNIDEEFQEFYNKFKNSVVIEVLPPTAMRVVVNLSSDSNESTIRNGEKKNYKKFRKVQPLRPQNSIIHTSAVGIKNNEVAEVTVLSDSEEDERPRPPLRQVNRSKRFDF